MRVAISFTRVPLRAMQQRRDVDAGDEQDGADRPSQHHDGLARARSQRVLQILQHQPARGAGGQRPKHRERGLAERGEFGIGGVDGWRRRADAATTM